MIRLINQQIWSKIVSGGGGGSNVKIATGMYKGNGTYGESNPNKVVLSFEPKLFVVATEESKQPMLTAIEGAKYGWGVYGTQNTSAKFVLGTTTIWWNDDGAIYQLNVRNTMYHYVAIGYDETVEDGQSVSGSTQSIPTGGIIIWSGLANAIPSGWALCDGSNGTPDLRDRFVLGAGTHEVGETGGSEEVALTEAQMPEHSHLFRAYGSDGKKSLPDDKSVSILCIASSKSTSNSIGNAYFFNGPAGIKYNESDNVVSKVGSFEPHQNMPPYYALCYIMKL